MPLLRFSIIVSQAAGENSSNLYLNITKVNNIPIKVKQIGVISIPFNNEG